MEIYGKNVVETAVKLKTIKIKKIFIDKIKYSKIVKIAEKENIPIFSFDQYQGNAQKHQKIIAIIDEYKYLSLDSLIEKSFQEKENPILVILDKIFDPQNLGAIIRNCMAFDLQGIILPKFNQTPVNDVAIKASAGTALFANIALTSSLNNVIQKLKKHGFWIVATSMNGNTELSELNKINKPLVIILGSEGDGVSNSLLMKSDFQLRIKMNSKVESLNVSSTSAIIFHHLFSK